MRSVFGFLLFSSILASSGFVFADGLGQQAFARTLYPVLRQNCLPCHGDGGIGPGHSVSDLSKAYGVARQYADFSSLEESTFVKRVRSKHWLKYDPTQKGMSDGEILPLLRAWWDEGEFSTGRSFEFFSAPVEIPQNLPFMSEGQYGVLTWDMGAGDSRLSGCGVKIRIQRAKPADEGHPGAYRVRDLTARCTKSGFSAKGIYLFVSEESASYENIFSQLSLNIAADGVERLTETEPMILIQRRPSDTLKLVFEKLSLQ